MITKEKQNSLFLDYASDGTALDELYQELTRQCAVEQLKCVFPEFVVDGELQMESLIPALREQLPLFTQKEHGGDSRTLSFFLLTPYRCNAFKFFFDLISGWLIPGHLLDVKQFYAVDFRVPEHCAEKYTLVHILIQPHSDWEREKIEQSLPLITSEVRLGVTSSYYARRILEAKGLSADQKMTWIHEDISWLISRRSEEIGRNIYSEVQHFLVLCPDAFKEARSSRHLSRLITLKYLFRKFLKEKGHRFAQERHLALKLFSVTVKEEGEQKRRLGVCVGMNFLSEKEVFEERHLFRALQNQMPMLQAVEGSYISIRRARERVATFYLEVEKPEQESFTREEIAYLTEELKLELKDRVEKLVQPLFMPRNEEEIMRSILALSHQIQYIRDIPQVSISFDEQTFAHLYFTIVHVAAKVESKPSIEENFRKVDTFLEVQQDFTKEVGMLRNKYPKEATVFRVKISKELFLRDDHSIDFYKARQVVLGELERVLGHLRDYNGGMIAKQNETLQLLREKLDQEGYSNNLLLDSFFYNLSPPQMRSIFDPVHLQELFILLVEHIESSGRIKQSRQLEYLLASITLDDVEERQALQESLKSLATTPSELVTTEIVTGGRVFVGYLYYSDDPYKQEHFAQLLSHHVQK